MEQTYQAHDILRFLLRKIKIIILCPILFAGIGFAISYWLITPTYEARADILVNDAIAYPEDRLSTTDIERNLRLIETYQFIIQSHRITDLVAKKLNQPYSNKELTNKLRIESHDNSQIISLFVKDKNLDTSVEIVNLYAEQFQTEIKSLMHMENVTILTKAYPEKHATPIMPKPIVFTVISFFIGFLFICTWLLIANYFFAKISSKQDIARYTSLPFLGSVGMITKQRRKHKQDSHTELISFISNRVGVLSSHIVEAYRTIRTNLEFQLRMKRLSTILITSTAKGEGKTVTAGNIAMMMALNNKKTVLIDADLRKEKYSFPSEQEGLSHYFAGGCDIKDILVDTPTANLKLIPSGVIPPSPAELLSSHQMDVLLLKLKEDFDRIIIDSPPLIFSDPLILSTKVDGCLLIIQAGTTKTTQLQQALYKLENVKANIFGIILNKTNIRKREIKSYNYYESR